ASPGARPDLAGPTPVAYSPDGQLLAIGDRYGRIQIRGTRTYEPLGAAIRLSSHYLISATFSPDDRLLASVSVDDAAQGDYLLDIAGGAPLRLDPPAPRPAQASFSRDGSRLVIVAIGTKSIMYPIDHGRVSRGSVMTRLPAPLVEAVFSPS